LDAKTAFEIGFRGGVIPALAALALFLAIGWLWPSDVARRYRAGLSFALGAFIGFVLLPATKTLAPSQFYDWILYLGILAALLSGLTRAEGVTRGERWSAVYIFAPIAAWLIVPGWPELVPAWQFQWSGLSLAVMLLTGLLYPLPLLLPGRAFPWWLMLAAATTSVLMLEQLSETFGVLAALPAGALAGCGAAALLAREAPDWRSLVLPYAFVAMGYAYTGAVYPTEPQWLLVLVPFAPLALWFCSVGPLARLTGMRATVVQAAFVIVPLVIIAALVRATAGAATDSW
jgi:hypothetical protein